MQACFKDKIGKKVAKRTIYRLLKRHDWYLVVPRPYHRHKNPERQEAFKKLSQRLKAIIKEKPWHRELVLFGV
ncbi:MAG: winged helix-turn-helix domain-containing protein [Flavobacteriaceae bacterium]|nr:winged helix-turn-helix domain-containing protein [Flavobacteriaceae bacterium]